MVGRNAQKEQCPSRHQGSSKASSEGKRGTSERNLECTKPGFPPRWAVERKTVIVRELLVT